MQKKSCNNQQKKWLLSVNGRFLLSTVKLNVSLMRTWLCSGSASASAITRLLSLSFIQHQICPRLLRFLLGDYTIWDMDHDLSGGRDIMWHPGESQSHPCIVSGMKVLSFGHLHAALKSVSRITNTFHLVYHYFLVKLHIVFFAFYFELFQLFYSFN